MMITKPIAKFISKSGKEIEIHLPSLEKVPELLTFVNRLTKEDTFLSLTGDPKTLAEEETWIKNTILNMKASRSFVCWAIYNSKIVGDCSINRGGTRDWHVGKMGLMVDQEFRRDGVGGYLLEYVLSQAKKMDIKIVSLDVFSDNTIAIKLYEKMGFKKYALLPNGLYRQNKYSDAIKMYRQL
ncbi:MAG: GCN5-related N-acetyltransferase [Berkelbacteria bacterium GW2011_GWA1_36_9]|uniref:GCN5-related N-acetyltransferase n=1 Tax=Berkelbacteria bacterium GW2011_GWA1_36_9 TaxID=1618331 RepID=A0A0G0FJK8_9BACT|nr:MAG: GCN5-related N-acetyltransferase [Berkelbacteria bacterium GW2011_GWA1_36_9]